MFFNEEKFLPVFRTVLDGEIKKYIFCKFFFNTYIILNQFSIILQVKIVVLNLLRFLETNKQMDHLMVSIQHHPWSPAKSKESQMDY